MLSRALGNTLDRYEEQGDTLILHIRWPLAHAEKEAVKQLVRHMIPGARVQVQKWTVTVQS